LQGTVRAMDAELRDNLSKTMERVIRGVTDAMGATYQFNYLDGYPVTVNDAAVCAMVRQCARETVGAEGKVMAAQTMGGEDMSYFLREVPGCFHW